MSGVYRLAHHVISRSWRGFCCSQGFGDPDITHSRRGWSARQVLAYLRARPGQYLTHIIMVCGRACARVCGGVRVRGRSAHTACRVRVHARRVG